MTAPKAEMARVRRSHRPEKWVVALVSFVALAGVAFAGTALALKQSASPAPAASPSMLAAQASGAPLVAPSATDGSSPDLGPVAPSAATARPPEPMKCTSPATSARAGAAKTPVLCVPVLEYHRIVPAAEAGNSMPGLVVPPETFAAQMSALKAAGWRTITLATLAGDLAAGRTPPAHTFVVTIDDGWYDGYKYALPILKADGFVATYFVISSRIGQADFLSASQLKSLIASGDEIGNHTVDHVDLVYLSSTAVKYELDTASTRIAAATGVRPRSFAYPDGGINGTTVAAVAACPGIQIAVTESRTIGETYASRFEVPRLEIGPGVSPGTLLTVLGG